MLVNSARGEVTYSMLVARVSCTAVIYCGVVLTCGCRAHDSERDFALPQVHGGIFHLRSRQDQPVLLAFLQTVPDTADTPSRSQAVFLSSMAHQYAPRGLRVAVIDASALINHRPPDHDALVNASYDWEMNFSLLEDADNHIAQHFGVTQIPTLLLLAPDGRIAQRWQGLTGPALLAQGIEKFLGGPLGRLPDLRFTDRNNDGNWPRAATP